MDLFVLYGAPAVGKLTIARALAQKKHYKIFDMNLTIPLLYSIFDREKKSPERTRINKLIRLEVIRGALEEKLPGLIFTYHFASHDRKPFVQELIKLVESYGSKVYFVHVTCSHEKMFERLDSESRVAHGSKLTDPRVMRTLLEYETFPKMDFVESLELDTTELSIDLAVSQILEHCCLEK